MSVFKFRLLASAAASAFILAAPALAVADDIPEKTIEAAAVTAEVPAGSETATHRADRADEEADESSLPTFTWTSPLARQANYIDDRVFRLLNVDGPAHGHETAFSCATHTSGSVIHPAVRCGPGTSVLWGSTAVGAHAEGLAPYSTAYGLRAKAGSSSTAIGWHAIAGAFYIADQDQWEAIPGIAQATAIGPDTRAVGTFSTAIGGHAWTDALETTVVGGQAWSNAPFSSVFGNSAYSQAFSGTALGNSAAVTADYGVAIGGRSDDHNTIFRFATASGPGSIALGSGAWSGVHGAAGTIAIGHQAEAREIGSIYIGSGWGGTETNSSLQFGGAYSIGLGWLAYAPGANSVAIGSNATGGTNAIALGKSAGSVTGSERFVALGLNALTQANDTVVIGANASVTAEAAVALGTDSSAGGTSSVALGDTANAGGANALAIGPFALASGDATISIGVFSQASGLSSTAIGTVSSATGLASSALGGFADATAAFATAAGYDALASGSNATAVGSQAVGSGVSANAIGAQANASGDNATAIGTGTNASGLASAAIGFQAQAGAFSSAAIGTQANAAGAGAIAVGYLANAAGGTATALGPNTSAGFDNSVAIGNGAATTFANQILLGLSSSFYTMPGLANAANIVSAGSANYVVTSDGSGNLKSVAISEFQLAASDNGPAPALGAAQRSAESARVAALESQVASLEAQIQALIAEVRGEAPSGETVASAGERRSGEPGEFGQGPNEGGDLDSGVAGSGGVGGADDASLPGGDGGEMYSGWRGNASGRASINPNYSNAEPIAANAAAIAQNTTDIAALQLDFTEFRTDFSNLSNVVVANSGDIKTNTDGVALALAMAGVTSLAAGENFSFSANYGFFNDSSAFAFSGAARVNETFSINAGFGFGADTGEVGGRAGVRWGW